MSSVELKNFFISIGTEGDNSDNCAIVTRSLIHFHI